MGDTALAAKLTPLTGRTPTTADMLLARTLFTRAIETPGGFKVQTIHAFCERLLQRFPLEAGVAPGFQILDDATGKSLIREAINDTLTEATGDRTSPLGRALTAVIRYAADDEFDKILGQAITKRELLDALTRRPAANEHDDDDPFATASDLLHDAFDARRGIAPAAIRAEMSGLLPTGTLIRLADVMAGGSKTDVASSGKLKAAAASHGELRLAELAGFFLTKDGGQRKSLMTKALAEEHPGLLDDAVTAQHRFHTLDSELRGLDVIAATLALYRLADAVLNRYRTAKAARAALDFEDLIVKTANLLSSPEGAAWVLFKLDGGLDHILVDEAQDTSPAQWQVVQAIAGEFFADSGAGSKAGTRTVFAVGDEKQSIYSFQGAAPEMFAAMGARFKAQAAHVGMPWRATALTLSFRTVAPILEAVDEVFADATRTPGLLADDTVTIRHAVKRAGHGGLVEIWPTERPDDKVESDAWAPLEETTASSPVTRLAARIADTIRGWIDRGDMLVSEGRPIQAGDIIVLVAKREPFASAIVAALKNAGVEVAGADRIALGQQIGVQDLIALGDFLTLPEDDLSLATVLKSPLFGLDDDDLLVLAHGRKGTLWKALLDAAPGTPRFNSACEQLKRWRKEADFMPPFEFYAAVLDHDGGRRKLLERLGPEAADSIDELLNLALTYDDQAPPSLTGFLTWLRSDDRTIKRDMEQGRNEVRILTVHGAKGLEAPIVFLPDTCRVKSGRSQAGVVELHGVEVPPGMPQLVAWNVKGSSTLTAIQHAKAHISARETEERNRLLYVALTRPRDRLYIAGVQTRDALPAGCWYDLVSRALEPHLKSVTLPDGSTVRRLEAPQEVTAEPRKSDLASHGVAAPRPAWMSQQAPREAQPTIPVAPSRLAPYDFDETGEPVSLPVVTPHIVMAASAATQASQLGIQPPEDSLDPRITAESQKPTRLGGRLRGHDEIIATAAPGKSSPSDEVASTDAPQHPSEQAQSSPALGSPNRFLRGTLTHALLQHLPSLPPTTWPQAATAFLDRRATALPQSVRRQIGIETLAMLHNPVFAPLFGPGSLAEVPIVAELANPKGKGPPLKLHGQIDRLFETPDCVLVIDYKTNRDAPDELAGVSEAYIVQLAAYKLALAGIFPGKPIRAALLWTETAHLMEIPAATLDSYGTRLWELGLPKG